MYILEGNIGAGKSTFLRLISQHMPEVQIKLEPVNNWQKQVYGQSLLTNFYQEPKRWAYTFETLTMICRVQEHIAEQNKSGTNIVERSIYSGYYGFAKNSFENGFLTALEWELYQQWFAMLVTDKCTAPRGFIYLRVTPDVAYERIKKRNRFAEKTLSLAYLKQIHQKHEELLIDKNNLLPGMQHTPVLVLDCNQEFETNPEKFEEHITSIKTFLKQTQQQSPAQAISNEIIDLACE